MKKLYVAFAVAFSAGPALADIAPPRTQDPPTLALWIGGAIAITALVIVGMRRRKSVDAG